jgi:hypothetical protein
MKTYYKFVLLLLISTISLNSCVSNDKEKKKETTKQEKVEPEKKVEPVKKVEPPVKPVVKPKKEKVVKKEEKKEEPEPKPEKKFVDPLSSWNNASSKKAITNFVKSVTTKGSNSYVKPEDRIATFDNDGTLWAEQPTYFQIEFILYRIKQLQPKHPEWKKDKLIQAALKHDLETLRDKFGTKGLGKLMAIAQSGMTTDEFNKITQDWIKNAKHPTTGKRYTQMIYQPMHELIGYLQENGFKVYIVSGGGLDFMRAWTTEAYGIPQEQVLGSIPELKYEIKNGSPVLVKLPEILFVNDGPGKPATIHRFVGKKPIMAFGNSDGDIQMLEWCNSNKHKHLSAFIHHTDGKREWAYDKESRIGTLNRGLDEATKNGWMIIDMKKEWKEIYP